MNGKKAIKNALEYYILANAGTKYDAEKKVAEAKKCLDELMMLEELTPDWVCSKHIVLSRVIRIRRMYLDRTIKSAAPDWDMSKEKDERKVLVILAKLYDDYPELPL